MTSDVTFVETEGALCAVADRAARAGRIAVDAESSGLHTYHARLCVLQLAWYEGLEGDRIAVAVVDAPAAGVAAIAPLLHAGPTKVLHDLTFDARLLAAAGAPLAGVVRDTSVAARLLGFAATGLAALLASELSVHVSKRFQQHDWSRRPITAEQLDYLAGDVRHLLALDEALARLADERDLAPEIAEESAHKLAVALGPPRDPRPGYVRVKGAAALDPPGRAALRRLWRAREAAAEAGDVPPFKVAPHEVLVALAAKRPATLEALAAVPGARAGRAAPLAEAWLEAIALGLGDGDLPEAERALLSPPPPDREALARRRALEAAVTGWRKAEAKRRRIDEQAVLPGHCADAVVGALLAHGADPSSGALREAIAGIPGFGARRRERYLDALVALVGSGAPPRPA